MGIYRYKLRNDFPFVQEQCSSLNGTLASHAIFKGMGVGNSQASALGATYTWLMKGKANVYIINYNITVYFSFTI